MKNQNIKRVISLIGLLGIIAAWMVGVWRSETDSHDRINNILEENYQIEQVSDHIFIATSKENSIYYVATGQAKGYEGPIVSLLLADSRGAIIDLKIVEHTETPSYYNKVIRADFTDYYLNKTIEDIVQNKNTADAVSGATFTAMAISNSVYEASVALAIDVYKIPVPPAVRKVFHFTFLEILILLFFVGVIVSRKLKTKLKIRLRYTMLILAVVSLGFTYNFHMSISRFSTLILGYWPDIYNHLAWYMLVFGIIILSVIQGKNPYCHWFCPFGAVQEGIGKIGKTRLHFSTKFRKIVIWVPRTLAWIAIVIALIFRNPGLTSYEVFGKFFTLTGSDLLFALTLISLIFSLFIKNPWCNFVCPVPPVIDYLIFTRKQFKQLWQRKR